MIMPVVKETIYSLFIEGNSLPEVEVVIFQQFLGFVAYPHQKFAETQSHHQQVNAEGVFSPMGYISIIDPLKGIFTVFVHGFNTLITSMT